MFRRLRQNPLLWRFIKFSLVGGVGFLIAWSILWIFTEKVGLWYMMSAIIAQVAATIWNFSANNWWTWRQVEK